MDTFAAIATRRSCRQFTDEPVSDAEIEQILRAAMAAPSAGNEQAWQFIVVRDRATLQRIPQASPYAAMARQAAG